MKMTIEGLQTAYDKLWLVPYVGLIMAFLFLMATLMVPPHGAQWTDSQQAAINQFTSLLMVVMAAAGAAWSLSIALVGIALKLGGHAWAFYRSRAEAA